MARRIPRDESLARVHGVGALFSAAYGNVGSSIYYALGVTAAFALGLTPVAFVIAGLIFMCTAATYSEATVMFPEAGGSSSFARHAFNELISFFAAWGQMLNYIITVAISAFFVPHYLAVFWSPLRDSPGDIIGGVVVILFLAALNVKGTQESTRLNLVLAIADLCTQVILVGIGLVLVFSPDILTSNVHLGVAPSWGDFFLGIAVGMIAYTGIETISNMSEEAKDASKTIPRGTGLTVLAVLGLYTLLPLIALSAMPVHHVAGHYSTDLGTKFADDPVLGIVENLGLGAGLTNIMRYYVGVLAAVILLIATNAALIGVSRLTFSMGHYRQLPERLRQIHPKYRTPYIAIIVFSLVASITLIPGETELLATLYSFGAMLSFTIAHISVIKLRQRFPDKQRDWKPPGSVRISGFDVPLTAVFGGLGTFAAWIVVMVLNPRTLVIGAIWMLLGISIYLLYRRSQGLSPSQTHKVLLPEPLGVEEVEYKSVLVAFEDDEPFSEQTMVTAIKLAAKRRRGDPRDLGRHGAEPPAARCLARRSGAGGPVEDRAGEADRRSPRQRSRPPGQAEPGRALDRRGGPGAEGERAGHGPPLPQRRALYGKALQTVLAERPCRVIVVGEPERAREAAGLGGPAVGAPA